MTFKWIGILLLCLGVAPAQTAVTEFVASIKPHKPLTQAKGVGRVGISISGTRAHVENMSAYGLIAFAYDLAATGLRGGPGWAESDSFDIELKADGDGALTRDQFRPIFKAFLKDRFKLSIRPVTERKPVYALVVAKKGPTLKESAPDAVASMRMADTDHAEMSASKWTMAQLARQLSHQTQREVLDKTGLTGSYDFKLAWTGESTPNPVYPQLFTALEEQLGLRLENQRAEIEILTIDHIERPSEN